METDQTIEKAIELHDKTVKMIDNDPDLKSLYGKIYKMEINVAKAAIISCSKFSDEEKKKMIAIIPKIVYQTKPHVKFSIQDVLRELQTI